VVQIRHMALIDHTRDGSLDSRCRTGIRVLGASYGRAGGDAGDFEFRSAPATGMFV